MQQSDNVDIGEFVDNNDSSDSSEYEEDRNGNVTLIRNNEKDKNLDIILLMMKHYTLQELASCSRITT